MFTAASPRILVIFEMGFSWVMSMAMTSVFFLDFARLNSDSSSILLPLSGSSMIMRTKPNSPASAMDNA